MKTTFESACPTNLSDGNLKNRCGDITVGMFDSVMPHLTVTGENGFQTNAVSNRWHIIFSDTIGRKSNAVCAILDADEILHRLGCQRKNALARLQFIRDAPFLCSIINARKLLEMKDNQSNILHNFCCSYSKKIIRLP